MPKPGLAPLGSVALPVFPCPHSIWVTRKVPSAHLIVGICVAPVPAVGAQEFPFQNVLIAQPPGGGVGAATVGLGPPLFSQESWPVPSLH